MSRADLRDTHIRAMLETIGAELAVIRKRVPVTRLRVTQARERTGLTALLSPALDELDDVAECVSVIGEQVTSALDRLLE